MPACRDQSVSFHIVTESYVTVVSFSVVQHVSQSLMHVSNESLLPYTLKLFMCALWLFVSSPLGLQASTRAISAVAELLVFRSGVTIILYYIRNYL